MDGLFYVKARGTDMYVITETRRAAIEEINFMEGIDAFLGTFEPFTYSIVRKHNGVEYGEEVIP